MKPFTLRYNILHGGDLNENGNFTNRKLTIHGNIILHGGYFNENAFFQREIIDLIFWDQRIIGTIVDSSEQD